MHTVTYVYVIVRLACSLDALAMIANSKIKNSLQDKFEMVSTQGSWKVDGGGEGCFGIERRRARTRHGGQFRARGVCPSSSAAEQPKQEELQGNELRAQPGAPGSKR